MMMTLPVPYTLSLRRGLCRLAHPHVRQALQHNLLCNIMDLAIM